MRERVLLAAAAVLVALGVVAAVRGSEPHVGPEACARRVADALHLAITAEPSVEVDGDEWVVTAVTGRLVLRVTGTEHEVTRAQALAGPDADVLERPDRLRALAVQC